MTALAVLVSTEQADHAAVVALIQSAEQHELIRVPFAQYLLAAVLAVTEERAGGLSPARTQMVRTFRAEGLRLLAEVRRDWEPDDNGRPVWDGEIGQVVRYLAAQPPRHDVEQAWGLLCESVTMLLGLADQSIDPVNELGADVPGTVEGKRLLLEEDAEQDAQRAVTYLLAVDKAVPR